MVQKDLMPMSRQSGAIDYLYELNHLASDVYNHSLRVSILAGVIAKWMRIPQKKTHDIILAGFMHDIGKTKFSERRPQGNRATDKWTRTTPESTAPCRWPQAGAFPLAV